MRPDLRFDSLMMDLCTDKSKIKRYRMVSKWSPFELYFGYVAHKGCPNTIKQGFKSLVDNIPSWGPSSDWDSDVDDTPG